MSERATTGKHCGECGGNQTGVYDYAKYKGWSELVVAHKDGCSSTGDTAIDCYEWDRLKAAGAQPKASRPFGPDRTGSRLCRSGSIASGGRREYCTCDTCF